MSTKEPKAVLHICCDESRHMQCRNALAEYFSQLGFIVTDCKPSGKKEMFDFLQKIKEKYADLPHLLVGCAEEAVVVQDFIKEYPDVVEGAVLAGGSQEEAAEDKNLPILKIAGAEEDCMEMFRRIYHWAEERLDEMLYRAATKY